MTGISAFQTAKRLLETDPSAALPLANEAVGTLSLDAPEMPSALLVLAEALAARGLDAEIVALVQACLPRFPRFAELRYREGLAWFRLGRPAEMFTAFEACLAIGDATSHPGTAGAGTYLPLYQLGLFAESRGDARTARQLFEQALSLGAYEPAAERLRFLEVMRSQVRLARARALVVKKKQRPLTILASLPPGKLGGRFLAAWNELLGRCRESGVRVVVAPRVPGMAPPWQRHPEYDFVLWLDGATTFRLEDIEALARHQVDVAVALRRAEDGGAYDAIERLEAGRGSPLTSDDLAKHIGLVPVDYCGLGVALVRSGVLEQFAYPWHEPAQLPRGFDAAGLAFCELARHAGIPVFVDPGTIVDDATRAAA